MNDNTPMPFGEHKGTKMGNVPAAYLLYIYDNYNLSTELMEYIEDNMDVLKMEVKS